ncbi:MULTISPECIES: extracellular solute-binding protein [unclassified Arthrobacter]|uniref:extracellular solute-binding protein n=1 Tax=unclassified Arthrobacter TaxID=235627 RepID=UPI0021077920|nr:MULTISPECIES: extracellular solute-binding protein [unclassified Arthrobacter]MCQ1947481.1 extracellular solute-binding protein [Arthrobacter sp. zg-Y1116]MCQ1987433.1 extracellular solute-binding protein [Arthrobacter sp. zg-Y844]MCQ1996777.1 extracellular solute-binding protein [Arthrobacter sp. zg-Y1171]UWX82371.1 extracellular solute-binding protein [Arthrobacter sp. zg-Y1171]
MKSNFRTGMMALAAAGALTVSSCGFGGSGDSGEEGGATTLDLLVPSYSDGTKALWEGVIEDFEAANEDISVNLQVESWENLESVLQTKIQAGEAPDIYNGGAFSAFADEGLLYPANEVASEETIADFQESFAENEMLDGTQYGLPLIASVRALFYNQDLFDAAGIQAPPTTWDELHAAAQEISATGVPGYGMPLGSEEAQGESLIWFAGNGGGFGDESEIAVNTPENLEAAEFMKKMISDGVTQPDPGATQRTPMINVFAQGQIGMVYALPQTVGQIEEENPDLNYGIASVPTNSGEPSTLGVADRLMAFKNDEDKQEAIKAFMDFFYTEDNYVDWVETEGFLPTTKSGSEAMGSDESLKPFLDMLPTAEFYPTTNPAWNATDGAFKSLMGQLEDQDAQTVLEQIQSKADAA